MLLALYSRARNGGSVISPLRHNDVDLVVPRMQHQKPSCRVRVRVDCYNAKALPFPPQKKGEKSP